MASPSWLPPLNSHNQYVTYVKASQPGDAVYDPSLFLREFSIKIKVCVNFYSDNKNSKERIFEGLSTQDEFNIYCDEVNPGSISSCEIITSMLDKIFIPFRFDEALWRERQLYSAYIDETRTCCKLSDDFILVEKILQFLCCMKLQKHNANKNKLPFKLEIEKMVTIPDQELEAWNSWYDEKKRNHPNFERDFQEAIRRPRTHEELMFETHLAFRGAKESCIRELEMAEIKDDSTAKTNCPICLEGVLMGSQAIRLPCLHIFHGNCIVKWLHHSHMCPLCRFKLPVDGTC